MNSKQFFKELAKAQKAQKIVENFMNLVDEHFSALDIFDVGITYCKGDDFLLIDSRTKGHVYQITVERIKEVLAFKSDEELYAYFDALNKRGEGV